MKMRFLPARLIYASCFVSVLLLITVICPEKLKAGDTGAIIIANNSIPESSLTSTDVKNIFLGKKTTWKNGKKITFVTLKNGELHKKFIRTYTKRNPSQFKNHWKKMLFTGKGVLPRSFSTDEDVVKYVSENDGVVGYISKEIKNDNIKIISVTN